MLLLGISILLVVYVVNMFVKLVYLSNEARELEQKLYDYYKDEAAKILIINGARQVGKSFIIRETASKYFKNYIEINLKYDYDGGQLFSNVKTTIDFYLQVSAMFGDKLNTIDDTIIFLDEIQVYPHLIS